MQIRDKIRERLADKFTDWKEVSARRVYFSIRKEDIREAVEILFKELGLRFAIASGIDTPSGIEILYHFSFDQSGEFYSLRVILEDKKHPEIESITPLFPGAEWIEREIWELLGVNFKNHPNLKKLLLAEDWPEGNYPLRRNNES